MIDPVRGHPAHSGSDYFVGGRLQQRLHNEEAEADWTSAQKVPHQFTKENRFNR